MVMLNVVYLQVILAALKKVVSINNTDILFFPCKLVGW
jgi:hypothetical protein